MLGETSKCRLGLATNLSLGLTLHYLCVQYNKHYSQNEKTSFVSTSPPPSKKWGKKAKSTSKVTLHDQPVIRKILILIIHVNVHDAHRQISQ